MHQRNPDKRIDAEWDDVRANRFRAPQKRSNPPWSEWDGATPSGGTGPARLHGRRWSIRFIGFANIRQNGFDDRRTDKITGGLQPFQERSSRWNQPAQFREPDHGRRTDNCQFPRARFGATGTVVDDQQAAGQLQSRRNRAAFTWPEARIERSPARDGKRPVA